MGDRPDGSTTTRLVQAASELFAERGFHRTTMRDIAARAQVNLAAAHYHFGSKKALYLEVLRAQFAELRASLVRRGAAPASAELARLSREKLIQLFRARCEVMLETMIGPPPSVHADLMVREMADPSDALPVIVDELIRPLRREMEEIVKRLVPALTQADVERCAYSVVGQVAFYRFMMPVVLRMMGLNEYSHRLTGELAAHVAEFSLGGMERAAASRRRSRRGR
jgi:AcrR family transcriptional regulator